MSEGVTVDAWIPKAGPGSTLQSALGKLKWLRESITRAQAEHVYIPTADGLAQIMGLIATVGGRVAQGNIQFEGLYMNGAVAHGGGVRSAISYNLVKRAGWARLFHLDPFVPDWETMRGVPPSERIRVMPELVEEPLRMCKTDARRRLSVPEEGRYLGLMGRLDRRKGADLLIEAFTKAKLSCTDRLLLLGPLEDEIAGALRNIPAHWLRNDRIVVRNAFVTDEELLTGIAAVDLVAAPYRATGSSSGIITRAVAAGRPIIGHHAGWMGKMLDLFSLGWGLEDLEVDTIAEALPNALDGAEAWTLSDAAKRLNRFNTEENHAVHWCELLRDRCGKPAIKGKVTWDWVVGREGQ